MAQSRIFHHGIKVNDLKETLRFMVDVLGMHIIKHEEKDENCKINCNGPWDAVWSKTMIGYGEESDTLVFEVAYNYGKHSYDLGNDSKFFAIAEADIPTRALHRGVEVHTDKYGKYLLSPTGHKFLLVPGITQPGVQYLAFNVTDIEKTQDFYVKHFNMEKKGLSGVTFPGKELYLQFYKGSSPIDHKDTAPRLCLGIPDLDATRQKFSSENIRFDVREMGPLRLFIATDPDGYEICVVITDQYNASTKAESGDALIDWKKREQKENSTKSILEKVKDLVSA